MKNKKISKTASVLLVAAIATMSTACTVEFSDAKVSEETTSESVEIQVVEEESKATETEASKEETEDTKETEESTDTSETSKDTDESTTTSETKAAYSVGADCVIPFDSEMKLSCVAGDFEVKAGATTVLITYNGNEFSLPIAFDNKQVWPYSPLYIQSNGVAYLYIGSSLDCNPGFHHDLNVYRIDGDSISYVDSTNGITPIAMADTESFICSEEETEDYGIDIRREYKVGENGMPVPISDIRTFHDVSNAVSFSEDISGYIVSNGKITDQITNIPAGTYGRLHETDGESYLDIELKDGTIVRLDWKDIFNECDKSDPFYIANAIIANTAAMIPCYDF